MRKLLVLAMLCIPSLWSMERISGWCEKGASPVVAPSVLGGVPLTRQYQQSYPRCTVTVYVTGTSTLATLYTTNSTLPVYRLTNPFQADQNGYYNFYVPSCNQRYDVQLAGGGLAAPFTIGDILALDLNDCTIFTGPLTLTGFISTGGQYNDFTSSTGGGFFRSVKTSQNTAGLAGGYIHLTPLTYNPNDGPPIFDMYGNPLRAPVMVPGDTLGPHDAVLFVGEATNMIPNPDLVMGLFTNVYVFSRVGFATDYASEASFQSLNGGMQALSFAAVNYVNSGQHAGVPPITNLDQFHPGAIYYDTAVGCERVFNGTSWSCMGSGGGGGSAAGLNTQVQYNGSGSLAASATFTFDPSLQLLNVVGTSNSAPAINAQVGFIQSGGGFDSLNSSIQSVQALSGGMNAIAFSATTYMQTGNNSGVPTLVSGDAFHAGALYWDTSSNCERVYNGATWACLGSGGSGSPGGTTTNVQYNNSGSFAGSNNFTWNNGSQLLNIIASNSTQAGLNVQIGFIQSAIGFVAVPASATTYAAVSALGGGMAAKSFTASNYIQAGNHSGAPPLSSGDSFNSGTLYYDTGANCLEVYSSGWSCLSTGGSTSPGGSTTSVQYNNAGSFGGSGNFTWNNGAQLLNVRAANSASAGINVQVGFIQSDIGFVAAPGTATTYNAIAAVGGGMTARSFTASQYIQSGNASAVPIVSGGDSFNPGALYYDTTLNQERLYNGSSWINLSGGGGGTPGGANTNVQFNSSGTLGGVPDFTWNSTSKLLNINGLNTSSAALNVTNGFIQTQVGLNSLGTSIQSVQAQSGGMNALAFSAISYIQAGHGNYSGHGPPLVFGDSYHAGALYWEDSTGGMLVYNGTSWVSLSGGSGSPGGANTNVQFNNGGGFAGSSNFQWFNASQSLSITGTGPTNVTLSISNGGAFIGGIIQSGLTAYNAISAIGGGGMSAKSFTSSGYIQTGAYSGSSPTVTPGDSFTVGAMSWNTSVGGEYTFNGTSWIPLGGFPGGSLSGDVQYRTGTLAFGGNNVFNWDNTNLTLNITSLGATTNAGLAVTNGFIQSQGGFVSAGVTYNALNVIGGGAAVRSLTAGKYIQTGTNSGTPAVTSGDNFHPGAMYWDTSYGSGVGALYLNLSNSPTWVPIMDSNGNFVNRSQTGYTGNVTGIFGCGTTLVFNGGILTGCS